MSVKSTALLFGGLFSANSAAAMWKPKASSVDLSHVCASYYSLLNYEAYITNVVIIGKCKTSGGNPVSVISFTGTSGAGDVFWDLTALISSWDMAYRGNVNWRALHFDQDLDDEGDGAYISKGQTLGTDGVLGSEQGFVIRHSTAEGIETRSDVGGDGFSWYWGSDRPTEVGGVDYSNFEDKPLFTMEGYSMGLDDECNFIQYDAIGLQIKKTETFVTGQRGHIDTADCRLKVSQEGGLYVVAKDKDMDISVRSIIVSPKYIGITSKQAEKWPLKHVHEFKKTALKADMCTGHSLGAAMAKQHGKRGGCTEVIPFASPLVDGRRENHFGKVTKSRDYIRYHYKECGDNGNKRHVQDMVTTIPPRRGGITNHWNPVYLSTENTGRDCKPTVASPFQPSVVNDAHLIESYVSDMRDLWLLTESQGEPTSVHYKNLDMDCDCTGQCVDRCGTHAVCCKKNDDVCGRNGSRRKTCVFIPELTPQCTGKGADMRCTPSY